MTKLVVFKLDGDFSQGFKVNVEIFLEGHNICCSKSGKLPSETKLVEYLQSWQQEYRNLGNSQRIKGNKVIFTSGVSRSKLHFWGEQLRARFHNWLRADTFQDVNLWLRENLNSQELIRVLLCSDNQQVHQLPWNQWDLVKNYPHMEIALSGLEIAPLSYSALPRKKSRIRILAIFGNSRDIDLEKDLEILETFKQKNTHIESLIEPQPEQLYDCLWSDCWDIIFFAGHTETIAGKGVIYLNQRDILTIADLEYALRKAISNGLQLAIFNSCDGLGLAYALERLALPQAIVMREPIFDCVAHQFLSYFLTEYSSGQPLHLATRRARERLQAWDGKYPYSSWLPVLYQNQSATPLLWSDLSGDKNQPVREKQSRHRQYNYHHFLVLSGLSFTIAWCLQTMGWLQAGELANYDRTLSLRPPEARDDRILVITIDDRDIQYQAQQGVPMRGSLGDLTLVHLLTKLQLYRPVAIASDIVHDFAYIPQLSQIIDKQDNFVAICRVMNTESDLVSIEPPLGIPPAQTGFTNMAIDNDGVIRRHILGMSPDSVCQSDLSLSLRMALLYLDYIAAKTDDQTIYSRQFTEDGLFKIGNTIFPKIESDSGAYQLPKTENRGYQILLNYRATLPQSISLRAILEETSDEKLSKLIKEKIIFIGVKSPNNDLHYTPYSLGQQSAKIPGVFVHAQATSQLISSVLDNRKLLRGFSTPLESLWVFMWALIGNGVIVVSNFLSFKKSSLLSVIFLTVSIYLSILYLSYVWLLFAGYWLPLITPMLAFILGAISSLFWLYYQKSPN